MSNTNQDLKAESEEMQVESQNTTVDTEISNEAPSRKGIILKNKRLEKGLTLETVHEATKVPLDALKAIEEGYTIRTLSPFYIKGFLKIYATYLNVDVTEVVEDYHKEELPKVVKQEVDSDFEFKIKQTLKKYLTRQRKKQILAVLGMILVCFILFKVIVFFTHSAAKKPKKKPSKIAKQVKVQPSASVNPAVTNPPEVKKPQPKPEPPKIKEKPKPKPVPKPQPQVQPQVVAPPIVVAPVQKEITLTVRALKNSWLRVKGDGLTVFQSTLDKGAVETWQADNQIEITGKNIIHLEFELNGKLIGTLGRKNRKAKSVTVTKDGLTVTK